MKEQEKHINRPDIFYNLLRQKLNDYEIKISFGMMKVIKLPHSNNSSSYYLRKRSFYTSGVVSSQLEQTSNKFYLWNEMENGKGPDEITSCLYHYLSNLIPRKSKVLNFFLMHVHHKTEMQQ